MCNVEETLKTVHRMLHLDEISKQDIDDYIDSTGVLNTR